MHVSGLLMLLMDCKFTSQVFFRKLYGFEGIVRDYKFTCKDYRCTVWSAGSFVRITMGCFLADSAGGLGQRVSLHLGAMDKALYCILIGL